jgi:hypothetical protein
MAGFLSEEKRQDGTLVSFLLSNTFIVPSYLRQASAEDCELVMKLCSSMLEIKEHSIIDKCSQNILKDISKTHSEVIEKLHHQYKQEIQIQDKEKKALESRLEKHIRELEFQSLEQEKELQKRISRLEVDLSRANQNPETLRYQFSEEAERRIKQKDEDLSKVISLLSVQLEEQKIQLKQVSEEKKLAEEKLQAHSLLMSNSSRKGNLGEQNFDQLLIDKKGWHTTNTSKRGHAMDRLLIYDGVEIRFDTKNYTLPVPHAEIEKAKKDLLNNPKTDIGVVVSFQTEIRGIKNTTLLWTPQNQALIVIPNFFQQDIDIVLHFLEIIIDIMKPFRKILQQEGNDTSILLKRKIEQAIVHTQSSLSFNADILSDFNRCYEAILVQLEVMKSTMLGRLADQKTKVFLILESLTGKDSSPEEQMQEEVPTEKKKSQRKRKEIIETS